MLDDLDWKLIEYLSLDGRISNSELANKLCVTVSTITRRISSLLKRNLIKITYQMNPEIFGYTSGAIVVLSVDSGRHNDICNKFYSLDEVFLILKIINRPYLILGLHSNRNDILINLINNKILNTPDVSMLEFFFRSKLIKRSSF